ncbi:MAG TPA: methyltransferase domain-containing protein [Thermodesulfobacteriota bacterium]|nr:methyltransferase domain-containing protein [Thermodesulfobacteriota bacterium]
MKACLDKAAVRRSFSKAAKTYDQNSGLQNDVKRMLLARLPEKDVLTALDAGCGTGGLAFEMRRLYPAAKVLAVDSAKDMLEAAKENLPKEVCLFAADLESMPFKSESLCLAASNLAYQWSASLEKAFAECRRTLRQGGRFVFSTLGPGTFRELKESVNKAALLTRRNGLPPFMEFTGPEKLADLLLEAGFAGIRIESKGVTRYYKDAYELLRTLKRIGAVNPNAEGEKSLGRGALLKAAFKEYEKTHSAPAGIIATYEVLFVSCGKP